MLRLLQLDEHLAELVLAQGEVGDRGLVIDGVAAAPVDVAAQGQHLGGLFFKALRHLRGLPERVFGLLIDGGVPLLQGPVAQVRLGIEVQKRAEDGHQHDDHEPGDLSRRVHGAVQEVEHHDDREDHDPAVDVRQELLEPVEDGKQEEDLHREQDEDEPRAAEYHPEYPLPSLLQEPYACVPYIIVFHLNAFQSRPASGGTVFYS